MAINENILMQNLVPDLASSVAKGLAIGREIKEAPYRNRLLQMQVKQQEDEAQRLALEDRLKEASVISGAIGESTVDDLMIPENYNKNIDTLKGLGINIQPVNDPNSEQFEGYDVSASRLYDVAQVGKRINDQLSASKRTVRSSESMGGGVEKITWSDGTVEVKVPTEQEMAIIDEGRKRELDYFKSVNESRSSGTVTGKENAEQVVADEKQQRLASEKKAVETAKLQAEEEQKAKNAQAERDRKREYEKAAAEGRKDAELNAKIFESVSVAAQNARKTKPRLKVLKNALADLKTGKVAKARSALSSLIPGIADANAEVFDSLITKFAMDELALQSGTKTDQDMQNAKDINAQLGNTREANEAIITILMDNLDRAEAEEYQLKMHKKGGGNEYDFRFKEVPQKHINYLLENKDDKSVVKQFKDKYGYIPSRIQ